MLTIEQSYVVLLLNVFLIIFAWKFLVRPTLFSMYKSKLELVIAEFDLYLAVHSLTDDETCLNVRRLILTYIDQLGTCSIAGLIIHELHFRKSKFRNEIIEEINKSLTSDNENINNHLILIRRQCTDILLWSMLTKTLPMFAITSVVFIFAFITVAIQLIKRGVASISIGEIIKKKLLNKGISMEVIEIKNLCPESC